ncbi:hypothetical protein CLOM_g4514, partial [Closterium sp. NIES-68]
LPAPHGLPRLRHAHSAHGPATDAPHLLFEFIFSGHQSTNRPLPRCNTQAPLQLPMPLVLPMLLVLLLHLLMMPVGDCCISCSCCIHSIQPADSGDGM